MRIKTRGADLQQRIGLKVGKGCQINQGQAERSHSWHMPCICSHYRPQLVYCRLVQLSRLLYITNSRLHTTTFSSHNGTIPVQCWHAVQYKDGMHASSDVCR